MTPDYGDKTRPAMSPGSGSEDPVDWAPGELDGLNFVECWLQKMGKILSGERFKMRLKMLSLSQLDLSNGKYWILVVNYYRFRSTTSHRVAIFKFLYTEYIEWFLQRETRRCYIHIAIHYKTSIIWRSSGHNHHIPWPFTGISETTGYGDAPSVNDKSM